MTGSNPMIVMAPPRSPGGVASSAAGSKCQGTSLV